MLALLFERVRALRLPLRARPGDQPVEGVPAPTLPVERGATPGSTGRCVDALSLGRGHDVRATAHHRVRAPELWTRSWSPMCAAVLRSHFAPLLPRRYSRVALPVATGSTPIAPRTGPPDQSIGTVSWYFCSAARYLSRCGATLIEVNRPRTHLVCSPHRLDALDGRVDARRSWRGRLQ